jgi:hypothetical protein
LLPVPLAAPRVSMHEEDTRRLACIGFRASHGADFSAVAAAVIKSSPPSDFSPLTAVSGGIPVVPAPCRRWRHGPQCARIAFPRAVTWLAIDPHVTPVT